jgi:hypothetical protein
MNGMARSGFYMKWFTTLWKGSAYPLNGHTHFTLILGSFRFSAKSTMVSILNGEIAVPEKGGCQPCASPQEIG